MIYRYSYLESSSDIGRVDIIVSADNTFWAMRIIQEELAQAYFPHTLDPNKIVSVTGPIIFSTLEKKHVHSQ